MSSALPTQLSATDPAGMVDTARYPLDHVGAADDWVADARDALYDHGVAILPGFLRAEAVAAICAEAAALEPFGHHSIIQGTPYLGLPDESYPEGHPRRALVDNSLTAIAYDVFPPDSLLRALYEWPVLTDLIRRAVEADQLYHYADPFGALNVAAMSAGDELGWHFDQTDFVVSIALQSSERGGDFETVSRIRNGPDDGAASVAAVLEGDRTNVTSLPMTPGTLMLFEGRGSLHRVTPIEGDTPRYVALLAYDTVPGTDSTELLKLVRYGRLPGEGPSAAGAAASGGGAPQ